MQKKGHRKRIKKRKNLIINYLKNSKKFSFLVLIRKKKSHFTIHNNFTKKSVKLGIKKILAKII